MARPAARPRRAGLSVLSARTASRCPPLLGPQGPAQPCLCLPPRPPAPAGAPTATASLAKEPVSRRGRCPQPACAPWLPAGSTAPLDPSERSRRHWKGCPLLPIRAPAQGLWAGLLPQGPTTQTQGTEGRGSQTEPPVWSVPSGLLPLGQSTAWRLPREWRVQSMGPAGLGCERGWSSARPL